MRGPTTACFLLAASALVTALDDNQILSVFPGATNLTGATTKLPQFTLTVVTNETHALFSLNATTSSPSKVGWMGTGIGTAMANADFLVTWPNPNLATNTAPSTAWTLSHRKTTGQEAMPQVASGDPASSTAALFTFLPDLSTTDASSTFTAVTYLRLLEFPSSLSSTTFKSLQRQQTGFIYASSTVQPSSISESSSITQHNQAHAAISLDLSAPLTISGTGSSVPSSSSGSGDDDNSSSAGRSKRDMYLIAHAVLGSLGLLLFSPLAILLARFLRRRTWFPMHAGINLLAAVCVVIAFAIGVSHTRGKDFDDTHTRLGLALFLLVIVQVAVGTLAHTVHIPTSEISRVPSLSGKFTGKGLVRIFHIILGITIVVLGFVQVKLGFEEYEEKSDGGHETPMGVKVVFWVLVGVEAFLYVGGWVREGSLGGKSVRENYGAEKVTSQAS
ncbi:hypothetical protein MNV49_004753 [Pseudohyphozyma bogoriensis]|nr:hypothetical protein MNV49_004753 [Pseudohyphozyma bogoriensis]